MQEWCNTEAYIMRKVIKIILTDYLIVCPQQSLLAMNYSKLFSPSFCWTKYRHKAFIITLASGTAPAPSEYFSMGKFCRGLLGFFFFIFTDLGQLGKGWQAAWQAQPCHLDSCTPSPPAANMQLPGLSQLTRQEKNSPFDATLWAGLSPESSSGLTVAAKQSGFPFPACSSRKALAATGEPKRYRGQGWPTRGREQVLGVGTWDSGRSNMGRGEGRAGAVTLPVPISLESGPPSLPWFFWLN